MYSKCNGATGDEPRMLDDFSSKIQGYPDEPPASPTVLQKQEAKNSTSLRVSDRLIPCRANHTPVTAVSSASAAAPESAGAIHSRNGHAHGISAPPRTYSPAAGTNQRDVASEPRIAEVACTLERYVIVKSLRCSCVGENHSSPPASLTPLTGQRVHDVEALQPPAGEELVALHAPPLVAQVPKRKGR